MRKGLKKGFTLIELLVVIAIIAILATVVIINVTGARAKAARAQVESNMAVVSKVIAACSSFGGTFATGAPAKDVVICTKTNIADQTEKDAATGNYPKLPDNYSYSGTLDVPIVTHSVGNTLTCGVSGCIKVGSWDTDTK